MYCRKLSAIKEKFLFVLCVAHKVYFTGINYICNVKGKYCLVLDTRNHFIGKYHETEAYIGLDVLCFTLISVKICAMILCDKSQNLNITKIYM